MTRTILIKTNKATDIDQRITATSNDGGVTIYSYYNGWSESPSKTTFNKAVIVEYLKGCQIPKKYIKQLEEL